MPNSYFEFKQFRVNQDQCAMKVGTDGVLLGAWVNPQNAERILDIGTGSGLIALMLAQKSKAKIDAVEIEESAAEQAIENVENSSWSDRIIIHNTSFQDFKPQQKFDLIISNPPFFDSGPKAPQKDRATARHNQNLTITHLISFSKKILNKSGHIALILPVEMRRELVLSIAKNDLWIEKETRVIPVPGKSANRILFLLSENSDLIRRVDEIIVEENGRHQYSEEFKKITSDYYKFYE